MELSIRSPVCHKDEILPLLSAELTCRCHTWLNPASFAPLRVGDTLEIAGIPYFKIIACSWLIDSCSQPGCRSLFAPMLLALRDIRAGEEAYLRSSAGWSLAVITLSDKGSCGLREDRSGPEIAKLAAEYLYLSWIRYYLIPDDKYIFKSLLARLACEDKYHLILTTGGTGLGSRDIAPEITSSLLDKTLPGFSQAMLMASLAVTPRAVISRAVAGIIDRSLIVNLPGSVKAVSENLKSILPAFNHALEKLNGNNSDCGA